MLLWIKKLRLSMPIVGILLLFLIPVNQQLHIAQHGMAVDDIQCSVCQKLLSIEPAPTSLLLGVLFSVIFIVPTINIYANQLVTSRRKAIRAPPYIQ